MQVHPVFPGNQAERLFEIFAQFISRARLPRIVARGLDAAARKPLAVLEAAHVVPLPAMKGNGDPAEPVYSALDVDTVQGVDFLRNPISALNLSV
jgi:hypothetical protein